MTKEIPQPLPLLTAEEDALVSQLTRQQLVAIDEALLAQVTPHWRKVAMVVGRAMDQPSYVDGVPDTFYGQRVCALVRDGCIEVQGNPEYMHFSEVRIPCGDDSDVPRGA
ncbi:MAG: DUF3658 domain-containing protein [Zoogloeaceae bacterium]|nr:DUF3658 domain-containing protein [Zoogloeaceae bacterium]